MRAIFLDIDGVICCNSFGRLEDKKLRILQGVCKETAAKVVLSTDWRRVPVLKQRLLATLVARAGALQRLTDAVAANSIDSAIEAAVGAGLDRPGDDGSPMEAASSGRSRTSRGCGARRSGRSARCRRRALRASRSSRSRRGATFRRR